MPSCSLLFVGDLHADTVAPSSRKDDYWQTCRNKLTEIAQIAALNKVDAVIWAGDLFHKQEPSRVHYMLTNWLIDYFSSAKTYQHLVCMGNHDIQSRPDRWQRQPIGALVKSKAVTPLWRDISQENPTGEAIIPLAKGKVVVSGKMFTYECDSKDGRSDYYSVSRSNEIHHVRVCHSMLLPDGTTFYGNWTNPEHLVDSIAESNRADIYLVGHYHDYLGTFKPSWMGMRPFVCVNPGSLLRGSIDEYNLKRKVQIAHVKLDLAEPYQHQIEFISLRSAKQSEDVFYVQEIKKDKKRAEDIAKMAEMLKTANLANQFSIINPDDAMSIVFKNNQVKTEVIESVKRFVSKSRESL